MAAKSKMADTCYKLQIQQISMIINMFMDVGSHKLVKFDKNETPKVPSESSVYII